MICVSLSAFGAELAYAENGSELSRLFEDKVVYFPEQSIDSPSATYTGQYGYYSDFENGFFYLHISYNESSITDGENVVSVKFNIKNSSREYQFNVDENGFIHSEDYIEDSFEVITEFGEVSRQGQEIHIGIRFLNKNDKGLNNAIDFSICVNGSTYKLCNGIILEYEILNTIKVSTTKQSTTRKETTEKQGTNTEKTTEKKESTTKFKYNGSGVTTSQKFTYNGSGNDENVYEYYESYEIDGAEALQSIQSENSAAIPVQGNSSSLSPTAKLLYAVSIVLAASGTVIILYNVMTYKEGRKAKQKENGKD